MKGKRKIWSAGDRKKFKAFYRENGLAATMKHFGVSRNSAIGQARKLNVKVRASVTNKLRSDAKKGSTTSTRSIDNKLKKYYLTINEKQLAKRIDKSSTFVRKRLRQLGLIVPPETIEERRQSGRIKKGNVPANKGKKWKEWMSRAGRKASLGKCFKMGHTPHNAKERDGVVVLRHHKREPDHFFIRVRLGKWMPLQHYNYEKKYGKLPRGSVLRCRDGNTLNCKPENWELIDQKKNMQLNSITQYPLEIQQTIRLLNKLKATVYGHKKNPQFKRGTV